MISVGDQREDPQYIDFTHHDFRGRPARGSPVHGPALVDDMGERPHRLYQQTRHNCYCANITVPEIQLVHNHVTYVKVENFYITQQVPI